MSSLTFRARSGGLLFVTFTALFGPTVKSCGGDDGSWALSQEEEVEALTQRRRCWPITAIALSELRSSDDQRVLTGARTVEYRRQPVDTFV